jgi:hypothetical protein
LRDLSGVIASDDQLGDQRRDLLENISVIAEQGKLSVEQRKTGIVLAAYRYLSETLKISASAATIWRSVGPIIVEFFRLHFGA